MQAPAWISGFVRWRWMPSVALVSGSLVFVALAVLVVPEEIGSVAEGSLRSSSSRSRLENADSKKESGFELPSFQSILPGEKDEEPPTPTRQVAGGQSNVVQSIFHSAPAIALPVEPPDPNPPPPPPEPPPPPPTATIYTLENPPPPPPNPGAPPDAVPPDAGS
jgi:hypothetical protein